MMCACFRSDGGEGGSEARSKMLMIVDGEVVSDEGAAVVALVVTGESNEEGCVITIEASFKFTHHRFHRR
ncbi:hypothetical protein QVD17_29932 [Tagetes erecta]|uniref:Uncharacterized protein n=1 Tax=Tagetes erecta TaxID=13708 RepID=A0AAD8K4H5_TARER|nr:hypothetical protein QVD17_29932 [Tagetes erecta]